MSLDAWLLTGAVALSVIGFAWLALAMNAHWKQVRGNGTRTQQGQTVLRWLGSMALFASLIFCNLADHTSMAALVWIMTLTAGALMVTFTLTWRPSWLYPLSLFDNLGNYLD